MGRTRKGIPNVNPKDGSYHMNHKKVIKEFEVINLFNGRKVNIPIGTILLDKVKHKRKEGKVYTFSINREIVEACLTINDSEYFSY